MRTPFIPACLAIAMLLLQSRAATPADRESATRSTSRKSPSIPAIGIAKLKRTTPVHFEREILPILKENCLACHGATKPKAGLILESPELILKGGESGPAVVPKKSAESLLLKAASKQVEPFMPPSGNKAGAKDLTPAQLGLLQAWIDQGATGTVTAASAPVNWRPMPPAYNPIQAVAISHDGLLAVCSRGNRIYLHDLSHGKLLGELTDPALAAPQWNSPERESMTRSIFGGGADRDIVAALAFSPDGRWIASGGYRVVKLWNLVVPPARPVTAAALSGITTNTSDGKRFVGFNTNGYPALWEQEPRRLIAELKGDAVKLRAAEAAERALKSAQEELDFRKKALDETGKQIVTEQEFIKKATEAKTAADKVVVERKDARKKSDEERAAAEKRLKNMKLNFEAAETNRALASQLLELTKADSSKSSEELLKLAQGLKGPSEKLLTEFKAQLKDADAGLKAKEKAVADADKAVVAAEQAAQKAAITLRTGQDALKRFEGESVSAKTAQELATNQLASARSAAGQARKSADGSLAKGGPLAISKDGFFAATSVSGGVVQLWNGQDGTASGQVMTGLPSIERLAFGSDGGSVLAANGQAAVEVPLTNSWQLAHSLGDGGEKSPLSNRVLALEFSPDGKMLTSGGGIPSRGGEILLWSHPEGKLVLAFKEPHSDTVFDLSFSADGGRLASGGADRFARVWEAGSGQLLQTLEGHTGHVLGVSWRRHGRILATSGADKVVKIWDVALGQQKRTIAGFGKEVTGIQFLDASPEAVVSTGDNQVRLINEDGNNNVRTFAGATDYLESVAVTPDGRWVVAGGHDGVLRVWNGRTGKLTHEFRPPGAAETKVKGPAGGG